MSRLIDADKLMYLFMSQPVKHWQAAKIVQVQPTVDAVEVVRCRDCKWNKERECPLSYTSPISVDGEVSIWYKNKGNDYCSYGKRKGGAE